MTEAYKELWKQANCKKCPYAPYNKEKLCKLDKEEIEEMMHFGICPHERIIFKKQNKKQYGNYRKINKETP